MTKYRETSNLWLLNKYLWTGKLAHREPKCDFTIKTMMPTVNNFPTENWRVNWWNTGALRMSWRTRNEWQIIDMLWSVLLIHVLLTLAVSMDTFKDYKDTFFILLAALSSPSQGRLTRWRWVGTLLGRLWRRLTVNWLTRIGRLTPVRSRGAMMWHA